MLKSMLLLKLVELFFSSCCESEKWHFMSGDTNWICDACSIFILVTRFVQRNSWMFMLSNNRKLNNRKERYKFCLISWTAEMSVTILIKAVGAFALQFNVVNIANYQIYRHFKLRHSFTFTQTIIIRVACIVW